MYSNDDMNACSESAEDENKEISREDTENGDELVSSEDDQSSNETIVEVVNENKDENDKPVQIELQDKVQIENSVLKLMHYKLEIVMTQL